MTQLETRALLALTSLVLRDEKSALPQDLVGRIAPEELRRHRLAGILHQRGASGFETDFTHDALAGEFWGQALAQVLSAFAAKVLDVCRLKGCAYFLDLYSDPGERPMGDLDLLVRAGDFTKACRVLESLGFIPRTDKTFTYAPSHHARAFDRGDIAVDLHRHIMQQGRSAIDMNAIWRRADLCAHRPEAVDEILLHICHIVRSELMVPLVAYVDLRRLLTRSPASRRALLSRCDDYRVGRGVRVVLAMLERLTLGPGERGLCYPLPSADDVARLPSLPRTRQLLAKAFLVEGPREFAGLAMSTLRERRGRW